MIAKLMISQSSGYTGYSRTYRCIRTPRRNRAHWSIWVRLFWYMGCTSTDKPQGLRAYRVSKDLRECQDLKGESDLLVRRGKVSRELQNTMD